MDKFFFYSRRGCCVALYISFLAIPTSSCTRAQEKTPPMPDFHEWNSGSKEYSESRKRMWNKFGGRGLHLVVDAMEPEKFEGVEFFPFNNENPIYASSVLQASNKEALTLSSEIPEKLRIVWRKSSDHPILGKFGEMTYADPIINEFVIPFGERIPENVIRESKDEDGGLRLKVRLSNDGPYFGWDIERRPGYKSGTNFWYPPCYVMTGGDFKEARSQYYRETPDGKCEPVKPYIREKGWYIDKKTGQRIETDY